MSSSCSSSRRSLRCCSTRSSAALQHIRLPRGLSVAIVLLAFAAALALVIVAIATAVVGETKTAANRFNDYFTNRHGATGQTSADRDVDRFQQWLNTTT